MTLSQRKIVKQKKGPQDKRALSVMGEWLSIVYQ
jgi:hypothetical protein